MQLITCMSKKSAPWVALTKLSRVFFTGVAGESPEGEGPIFYAVTRRDDWHPARINKTLYQNVQYQGSGRWTAQELNDNGKARKVRLRLKRDGFIHTTSYINGRKKVQWAASKK